MIAHQHGGQLHHASKKYDIPLEQWIDLSTGINPTPYPLPPIPPKCWQRLPETNDGLEEIAANYYGTAPQFLLPVSGSQEAIQLLPQLRQVSQIDYSQKQRVGILSPAYQSHRQTWQQAGAEVLELNPDNVAETLPTLDVLLIVNPTNPTAQRYAPEQLLQWHQQLQNRTHKPDGWLIVDEAFIDTTPEESLIQTKTKPGLIMLRSTGKFFGLAGMRLGFVWAEPEILNRLAAMQNDWSVSHPARWAGKIALQNRDWQQQQRIHLAKQSQQLTMLLEQKFQHTVSATALFAYVPFSELTKAQSWYEKLAQNGILTRLFESPAALRFGLPGDEMAWKKLETILKYGNK